MAKVLTMHTCKECGYVNNEPEAKCPYCGANLIVTKQISCVPMAGGSHFQFDRELALLLQEYSGEECLITIERL